MTRIELEATLCKNEYLRKRIKVLEKELIDTAVIWIDENVGTLTAIALRKHLEA